MLHEKRDLSTHHQVLRGSEIGPNISETHEFLFIMITVTMILFFGKQISQLTIAYAFSMSVRWDNGTGCVKR